MKQIIRKQVSLFSLVIILIIVSAASVSYAVVKFSASNTNNQIIKTNNLDVVYGSGNSIIDGELHRISDQIGQTTTGYNISLNNNNDQNVKYSIYLYDNVPENFSGSLVNHNYIKVSVDGGEVLVLSKTPTNTNDGITEYEIYNGLAMPNDTIYHTIRVWMDDETPNSESGKYVYLQMKVVSEIADVLIKDSILYYNEVKTLSGSAMDQVTESGLYSTNNTYDGSTTYFFRGPVNNNYIKLGNELYRIIRINGDDSIRIIKNQAINSNVNYNEGLAEWFNNNLSGYKNKLVSTNFCTTNDIINIDCNSSTSYYGLVGYGEAVYMGAANSNHYLLDTIPLWTNFNGAVINLDGRINTTVTKASIKPVINLKAQTFVTGDGTFENPFIVQ